VTEPTESPEWLEHLEAHSNRVGIPVRAYEVWADNFHLEVSDWADFADELQEAWYGEYDSDSDFAEDIADSTNLIPEAMPHYWVDWEAVARDLLIDDFWTSDGYYFASY